MCKPFSVILVLLISFSLISCGARIPSHAEMRIPLENFSEIEAEGFDKAYSVGDSVVAVLRISFEAGFNQGIPETFSPRKFAEFYMKESGRSCDIFEIGNIPYYEYVDSGIYHLASFYRSRYAYFLVLFGAEESSADSLRDGFVSIAESIYFDYDY